MKAERLRAVADAIERAPQRYDQRLLGGTDCSTPACVASHAYRLFGNEPDVRRRVEQAVEDNQVAGEQESCVISLVDVARWALKLDSNGPGQSCALFAPAPLEVDLVEAFPELRDFRFGPDWPELWRMNPQDTDERACRMAALLRHLADKADSHQEG